MKHKIAALTFVIIVLVGYFALGLWPIPERPVAAIIAYAYNITPLLAGIFALYFIYASRSTD